MATRRETPNPYRDRARMEKVIAMLLALPLPTTREGIEEQAADLARAPRAWRIKFGEEAKLKFPPSDDTWDLFVAAARKRMTIAEALAAVGYVEGSDRR